MLQQNVELSCTYGGAEKASNVTCSLIQFMPTPSANGTRHSAQPKSCKFVISVLSHHHQLEQLNYEPVNRSLNTRRVLRSVLLTAVLVQYSDPSWLGWASVTMPILQSPRKALLVPFLDVPPFHMPFRLYD